MGGGLLLFRCPSGRCLPRPEVPHRLRSPAAGEEAVLPQGQDLLPVPLRAGEAPGVRRRDHQYPALLLQSKQLLPALVIALRPGPQSFQKDGGICGTPAGTGASAAPAPSDSSAPGSGQPPPGRSPPPAPASREWRRSSPVQIGGAVIQPDGLEQHGHGACGLEQEEAGVPPGTSRVTRPGRSAGW